MPVPHVFRLSSDQDRREQNIMESISIHRLQIHWCCPDDSGCDCWGRTRGCVDTSESPCDTLQIVQRRCRVLQKDTPKPCQRIQLLCACASTGGGRCRLQTDLHLLIHPPQSDARSSLKFQIYLPRRRHRISGTRILYSGFCIFSICISLPQRYTRL